MTKKIWVNNHTRQEEFEVIEPQFTIGDTVWFKEYFRYISGTVLTMDPDHWWIYDDGRKALGCCTVQTDDGCYQIDYQDILIEKPEEDIYYQIGNEFSASELKGKKISLTARASFDIEHDTDWIEIIQERVGEEKITKEQLLEFLIENNYIDLNDFNINLDIK